MALSVIFRASSVDFKYLRNVLYDIPFGSIFIKKKKRRYVALVHVTV